MLCEISLEASSSSTARVAHPTTGGGRELENRVELMMSTRSITPSSSSVPLESQGGTPSHSPLYKLNDLTHLPRGPRNPVAWHSSMNTMAPYRSARSQICDNGATSPSIEKTPSVTTRRMREDWEDRVRVNTFTLTPPPRECGFTAPPNSNGPT
ncbi:hypothetical protein EYF80_031187 [Liparis tanakae]|uniref:Uncharacterized protein n=1 Tax=Liparis tanakae TaxID=230148 RepID=A0A4Z2GY40_9TELE|nr:hypothetical protein EYF80_031187 [Liparis tanakae]